MNWLAEWAQKLSQILRLSVLKLTVRCELISLRLPLAPALASPSSPGSATTPFCFNTVQVLPKFRSPKNWNIFQSPKTKMQNEEQAAPVDIGAVDEDVGPRTYLKRNIVVEATDPIERRREYKKKYAEVVRESPAHRNKRRNIILTETDPVKRAAEYRKKYKELRKMESELEAPIKFESSDALAEALAAIQLDHKLELHDMPWSDAAELLARDVFDNVLRNRQRHMPPRSLATGPPSVLELLSMPPVSAHVPP
ncbi:hypothetical protein PAPYR_9812 [Paratrimastix pyriformis]|uniref:Uncharacterized protein n=1 Tax=Paratrimastix pyriformis TaxID=342808 RepID=A0ABQ8U7F3_9EUKA|nr:hypothetical protein PAPYR_9812 [Paratrimastix pyriformis]